MNTENKKCKVSLHPIKETLEVEKGENLMQALKKRNIYIKSTCGGVANCTDCKVKVMFGEDSLSPPTFGEIKVLGNVFHITKERLSCQCKVENDCQIDISNHDQREGALLKHIDKKDGDTEKKSVETRVKKGEVYKKQELKDQYEKEQKEKLESDRPENSLKKSMTLKERREKSKEVGREKNRRPKKFKYKKES